MHRWWAGRGRHLPRSLLAPGLVGYATYLPRYRLAGSDIGVRRGDRVVAAFDEDSTTMAVAAAAGIPQSRSANALYFATSTPAYADETNATAIHAALGLPVDALAVDLCGSGRSGFAAILAAANTDGHRGRRTPFLRL